MKILHAFTRGGQLAVHQYRMLKQICFVTFILSLLAGIVSGGFFLYTRLSHSHMEALKAYSAAHIKCALSPPQNPVFQEVEIRGRKMIVSSHEILHHPWILSQLQSLKRIGEEVLFHLLWNMFAAAFLVIMFFLIRGYLTSRIILERGGKLVSPRTLKRLIKKARQASDLTLDGLPLLKGKETSHFLITGTTGAGKTNALHTILPQIRARPNRAIIVDLTGDYVRSYFREGQDILLNPYDERSQLWSPWEECHEEAHYETLAAAIIPSSSSSEPFWENAGKALLTCALKELALIREKDVQKLYHLLVRDDLTTFSKFFSNTDAAPYTHGDGEKMTLSIRATLANALQSFKLLKPVDEGFSIRRWIAEESFSDQWLFLSAKPDQRETLRPLLSAWIDTALNALMSLEPRIIRKLWFVMDELPALQKLPSLEMGLAEARKYGACIVAGIQSVPQLATIYGNTRAQALLDLFNTKFFFRNTDPNTTAWISKVLGEAETTEHIENLSYGANTMRDGVNLAQHTRTKSLVLPTEIMALRDCEAYLKLSGRFPITKFQMAYKKR